WFLNAPKFIRWLYKLNKTLFYPRIPRASKTIIAAIAIDYLLKVILTGAVRITFIYYNYKAQAD
ncbi:uncharacterized protein K441DRAFT_566776, partial [Cenococcum geophilum 1.58]|uniref:uncharacterized protein n=1 Tax=Cenococcum geophilum 1.58 TaxID=794803 RepID=UPI00358FD8F8